MVIIVWVQNMWRMFFNWFMTSKDVLLMHLFVDSIMVLDKRKLIHAWYFSWIIISRYHQSGTTYIDSWLFFFVFWGMFLVFAYDFLPKGFFCVFGLGVKNGRSYWGMHRVEGFVYPKGTLFLTLCMLMN